MNAIEIIQDLREQNFTIKADGDYLELSPPEKITNELIDRLRKHKPAIIAELKRESRQQKALAMLADNPESKRAIIPDLDSDPDNVIMTIAIRDQCTFEMQIPKHKYDGLALLEMIHNMNNAIELNH